MRFVLVSTVSTASASLLRVSIVNNNTVLSVPGAGSANYGEGKCPCVGFDNVEGTTDVTIDGGKVSYPADLGARCEAWDADTAPACKGGNSESWCSQQWCYVDPCKCDIPVIPKISAYLPDSQYQGKPVYYSYSTCGGEDTYTEKHHKKACVNQATEEACNGNKKCAWNDKQKKCAGAAITGYCMKPLPVNMWGENDCRCVGIDNQPGTTKVDFGGGKKGDYPADVGATCDQWDLNRNPDCTGDDKKPWCYDRWCYVDPCSCEHQTPPKQSNYLPDGTFQGKPVFYSYATCGTEDQYTGTHRTKYKKRQAEVCNSAWTITPVVAIMLSFMNM